MPHLVDNRSDLSRNITSVNSMKLPALPHAAVPARAGGHAVLGARVIALVADVV